MIQGVSWKNVRPSDIIFPQLGISGIPPEIPSWGNIMSEGRTFFQLTPWIIFYPGVCLAVTVLAVNVVGDGLRDTLDPRIARNMR